jgi:cell division protein FtsI (penicillin-binding protein 3)
MNIVDTFKTIFVSQRRTSTLASLLFVAMGLIVLQLFVIQIIQHDYYKQKAYEEQVAKFVLPAKRGEIYAKEGASIVPLALNKPVYTVYADPQQIDHPDKVEQKIKDVAGEAMAEGYSAGLKDTTRRYVVLAKRLSYDQAKQIKDMNLAGVGLTQSDERVYPEGPLAGQVLGYVNNDGKGQYGVEESLDARLKGREGKLQSVTDVRRIPLTLSSDDISIPAKNGDNLVLSIDRSVQAYAEQALKAGLDRVKATKGSVVVMNPNTGKVIAMANYPNYDPGQFNKVEDYAIFQNAIVSEPYEVGSVMKTLSMGAGLDSGAVTKGSVFNDATGCVQVDDRKICNVEEDPKTARATMLDTLHYSLNTGVVYVLKQMGGGQVNQQARQTLYRYYHDNYRFGMNTGIEQAGEAEGVMIAPDKEQGNNVRYANMAFGQGMNISMIQMASAFSAAINGGTYYQPSVVAGTTTKGTLVNEEKPKVVRTDVLRPDTSQTLRDMIVAGRQAGALGGKDRPGYRVGGKTGTSQIIDSKTGQYTDENSIGSYIGFGGNQTPQYVIMVQVKDSKAAGYAGTTAAGPIFLDLSNWLIDYLQIPPN